MDSVDSNTIEFQRNSFEKRVATNFSLKITHQSDAQGLLSPACDTRKWRNYKLENELDAVLFDMTYDTRHTTQCHEVPLTF